MIFYRVVRRNPPDGGDYLTYADTGQTIRNPTPEMLRWATGYSVLNSLREARTRAKGKPRLGNAFIAKFQIDEGSDFSMEQTGTNLNHYTVWCSADLLRSSLVEVVPIEEDTDDV